MSPDAERILARKEGQLDTLKQQNLEKDAEIGMLAGALNQVRMMLPDKVTPGVKTGLAVATGLVLGPLNATLLSNLPRFVGPGVVAALGVATQFYVEAPNAVEGTRAPMDTSLGIFSYEASMFGTDKAIEFVRSM